MTPLQAVTTLLAICSPLAAQYVTSPTGFVNTEGNNNATFSLGDYRDGHFMYADGTHRGSPMSIKGTAYRLGNYDYSSSTGTGRKWTNVQLLISDCDLSQFSSTFSNNPTTTPTLVFSNAVDWPTQTGKPPTLPAAWSMQFPFSTNWSYSGNADICLDYKFAGGTLANGATWTSSGSPRYYKDAHDYGTSARATSTPLGYAGANVGCNDRGVTHVNGASIATNVTVYGQDYPTANLRGMLAYQQTGRDFALNKPALTVIGVRSLREGFQFAGVTCNNVHIDFSLPTFNIPSFSSSSGILVTLNLSAINPGLKGIEIVAQVVWSDSQNLSTMLSNAATVLVPEEPISQPQTLLYTWNPTATTGSLSASRTYQPLRRYTK